MLEEQILQLILTFLAQGMLQVKKVQRWQNLRMNWRSRENRNNFPTDLNVCLRSHISYDTLASSWNEFLFY